MYTRREFGRFAAGTVAAGIAGVRLDAQNSRISGVRAGAISYCFRSIPRPATGDYMDTIIDAIDSHARTCRYRATKRPASNPVRGA